MKDDKNLPISQLLIVDDKAKDLETARALLASLADTRIETATSGEEALATLEQHPAMLVVTGHNMPNMDGLQLLRTIRERFSHSPVIVMTAQGSEEVAAIALNEGASGYVPKRELKNQLKPIVQKVLNSVAARDDRQRLEEVLDFTETRFVLGNEPELVLPIIGYLQEKIGRLLAVDENDLLRIGLAIEEALTNAIYHGNLEVGSELRELDGGEFHEVASQRRQQTPFHSRKIHIVARVSSEEFECVIRDEGSGFTVSAVADPLATENIEKASGRGLLMIRQFMDEVRHNEMANEITMVKRQPCTAK